MCVRLDVLDKAAPHGPVRLTSLEKTGKKLPFVRVYNKVFGIHLVVLHVSVGDLSFPLGVRVYALENKETPIALALDLLCSSVLYAL